MVTRSSTRKQASDLDSRNLVLRLVSSGTSAKSLGQWYSWGYMHHGQGRGNSNRSPRRLPTPPHTFGMPMLMRQPRAWLRRHGCSNTARSKLTVAYATGPISTQLRLWYWRLQPYLLRGHKITPLQASISLSRDSCLTYTVSSMGITLSLLACASVHLETTSGQRSPFPTQKRQLEKRQDESVLSVTAKNGIGYVLKDGSCKQQSSC